MDDRENSSAEGLVRVVSLTHRRQHDAQTDRLKELAEILDAEKSPDERAIFDHEAFHDRFGFDWRDRADRTALIQLKNIYSLKDREIRMFFVTGNIKKSSGGVKLIAYLWLAMAACITAIISSCAGIIFFAAAVVAFIQGSQSAIIGLVFAAFYFYIATSAVRSQVAPALVQHRIEKRAGLNISHRGLSSLKADD